jgi:hypothetical protein
VSQSSASGETSDDAAKSPAAKSDGGATSPDSASVSGSATTTVSVNPGDAAATAGACGTRGGVQCHKDEYCKLDASCGATDRGGACTAKPQICTAIYAPVCGCDGNTYASDCTAAAAGVSVAQKGECGATKEPVACDSCAGPAPGAPNYLCPDGVHTGGPACVQLDGGGCGWQFLTCPTDDQPADCHSGKAPGNGLCWDDSQCSAGQSCIGASCCPVGAQCLVADKPGKCQ